MLPLHNVVRHVLDNHLVQLEERLLAEGKPLTHRRVHPEAMMLIHEAYYAMTMCLKEHPEQYETVCLQEAQKLAAAAIKFVADLGDPRVLRELADPDLLILDDDQVEAKGYDDPDEGRWRPLKEMPLGILTEEERQRSQKVRHARQRAEKARERLPKSKAREGGRRDAAGAAASPSADPQPGTTAQPADSGVPGSPDPASHDGRNEEKGYDDPEERRKLLTEKPLGILTEEEQMKARMVRKVQERVLKIQKKLARAAALVAKRQKAASATTPPPPGPQAGTAAQPADSSVDRVA
jgi:hypothetical protein